MKSVSTKESSTAYSGRSIVNMSHIEDNTWEVNRVFIQPEDRKKYLGTNLLTMAIHCAKEQGATSIFVTPGGYTSDQEGLYTFYNKCGFKHDKKQHGKMFYTNF